MDSKLFLLITTIFLTSCTNSPEEGNEKASKSSKNDEKAEIFLELTEEAYKNAITYSQNKPDLREEALWTKEDCKALNLSEIKEMVQLESKHNWLLQRGFKITFSDFHVPAYKKMSSSMINYTKCPFIKRGLQSSVKFKVNLSVAHRSQGYICIY